MPTEVLARSADAFNGVVVAPRPFEADAVALHAMPQGWSIAQMVERLEADGVLDPAVRPWLRVVLNDRMLPADQWSAVPAIGDALVIEVAAMARSNPVRTLLQIAVVALASFVGGAMGGVGGAIAAAAITIGGMAVINAIAPIKQPDVAQRQERYSLDGGSNAATPHQALPIVLGRRRIYPPRCANWYTRTVNNVVYLRMMFQPSVGWVDHASPRLGETDVASYEGVTLRWRTRPDETIEPAYFGDVTPLEKGWGVPITKDAGWVTRTFPMEADTLSMDVSFMAGLYETKESSGNPKNRSVTFEFRYGPKGGDPAAATPCPWTVGGQKTWTRDKLDAYREGFYWNVPRGEYDMHMRRVTADPGNTAKISDELTLVCLRAFRNEAAVADLTGKPWIEMEIQATEQLSGVPQDFNFVATSIVPQATAEGRGALIATRNPADLYLAASYPPFSDVELDEDERNFAAISAWRATCVAQGWNCDLAENGELSVGELLQRVAAMGRARPTLDFGALSVVVDWEKPLPRQMFTPRNVSGFVGELNSAEEIHALRLRFQNEDKDYGDDIAVVFAPGYDLDTATRYSSVEIRDKSNIDEVEREGVRLLAEPRLRPETFTFEQDWESLAIGEGDRAYLAHHVALVGEVSGRVEAQVVDLDVIGRKGLRLDELVVMEAGRSYDLAWRPSADAPVAVLALDTIVGQGDHVWFPLPAPANLPQPGDLVTVFEHAVELLDVVVNRISPAEGLKAEISCVPYAPGLQSLVEGEIPAYRTAASRPGGLASASIAKRTPRAIDQVLDQIGGAVDEAGKGIEAIGDGTGLVAGRPGAVLNAAVAAAQAAGDAASVAAGNALAALNDPANGALVRLDRLSKKGSGGALNPNGDFRDWPTTSTWPAGYTVWFPPSAVSRAATAQGDAIDVTAAAGQQAGFQILGASMSPPVAGNVKVVLEADIELVSGSLAGAALYLQADDGAPNFTNPLGVFVRFTDLVGVGVAGKSYRIRSEPLSLPYQATWTRYALVAMNHWSGVGSIAASNRIRWLRAEAFVASDVEAGYADDIALLTAADSAAVSRLGSLEAKARSLPNLIINGDGSASTPSEPLKGWAFTAAAGVLATYNNLIGAFFSLAPNASGAERYLISDWYGIDASMPIAVSLSGSLGGAVGSARPYLTIQWGLGGGVVSGSDPLVLDDANTDWLDRRPPLTATSPGSGVNQFRLVLAVPNGFPGGAVSRIMVNYGSVALPWNDRATERNALARTATLELAQATSEGALALLTNRVSTAMQQGAGQAANPFFGAYTYATGAPDAWTLFAGVASDYSRQVGKAANYAVRMNNAAGDWLGIQQSVYLPPGAYELKFDAWVSAGDWRGAGMVLSMSGGGSWRIDCGVDPDDGGAAGPSGAGIRSFSKKITVGSPGTYTLFALGNWTGFAANVAKTIDVRVCDVVSVGASIRSAQADATQALQSYSTLNSAFGSYQVAVAAEFTDLNGRADGLDSAVQQAQADATLGLQSYSTLSTAFSQYQVATDARFTSPTGEVQQAKAQAIAQSQADANQAISTYDASATASFGGLRAATGLLQSAMTTVQGRVLAWLKLTASSGGEEAKVEVVADDGSTLVRMVAKMISLANNVGGVVIDVLKIVGGEVFFGAPVSIDVASKRLTLGPGFGASGDLVMWFGPGSISVATMTKTNGHWAFATDGQVYYGTVVLGAGGGSPDAVTGKYGQVANSAPNTGTHTQVLQVDLGGVASTDLVEAKFLITQETGGSLSTTGTWSGGWEIVEQTTAGGSTAVRASGLLTIEDGGGGLLDIQADQPMDTFFRLPGRTLNGTVRYGLRLWRNSGPTITGNGIHAELRVQRTP